MLEPYTTGIWLQLKLNTTRQWGDTLSLLSPDGVTKI